jgi:hypothetical protein
MIVPVDEANNPTGCDITQLGRLTMLGQAAASALPLSEKLSALARLTGECMDAVLVRVLSIDQTLGFPAVLSACPPLFEGSPGFQPGAVERDLLENFQPERSGGRAAPDVSRALARALPLRESPFAAVLWAPLVGGTELLGLLCCYYLQEHAAVDEQLSLLTVIAGQVALALLIDQRDPAWGQDLPLAALFHDLRRGDDGSPGLLRQRALALGGDLTRAHVVVEIVDVRGQGALSERLCSQVRRRLQQAYPRSLVLESAQGLTCLLFLGADYNGSRVKALLEGIAEEVKRDFGLPLCCGVSNPCQQVSDFLPGFGEAAEALRIGASLNPQGGVTLFNCLGAYRYLFNIASSGDPEDWCQRLAARIAEYDRQRKTLLLDTLETYLDNGGNITLTATVLFVHRNTLLQRLARIQTLWDIDLGERGDWLVLQLAIKVYRIRQGLFPPGSAPILTTVQGKRVWRSAGRSGARQEGRTGR